MKIGVLTYHCPPNFGAQLQALSTCGYLKKQGHEVVVLNWYARDLAEMYSARIPAEQIKCHQLFCEQSFSLSALCQTERELIDEINRLDLDAIIVGSDALFKYIPQQNLRHFSLRRFCYIYHYKPLSCEQIDGNPFFGGFLTRLKKHIPAVVYAVSSQNCEFSKMNFFERIKMAKYLSNYKVITTRDTWTKQMVEVITHRHDVQVFPDPVFSFNQNCPITIPTKLDVIHKFGLDSNYVLLSFSDWFCNSDYINQIAEEVRRNGLQPVSLPMPEKLFNSGVGKVIDLPLSPLWWYALIIHSRGYIGERMHPIVVCLHNSIPFFSFDEYGTNTENNQKLNGLSSSKTFLIVKDSSFLNCYYSYQSGAPVPNPQLVVKELLSFDVDRCRSFANSKLNEYKKGIDIVLQAINN